MWVLVIDPNPMRVKKHRVQLTKEPRKPKSIYLPQYLKGVPRQSSQALKKCHAHHLNHENTS